MRLAPPPNYSASPRSNLSARTTPHAFPAGKREATCKPIYRDAATGLYHVPSEVQVPGSQVTLTHALQGYCVAEYQNGIDADPTYLPLVEDYISYFNEKILPKFSLEDLPTSKELPSSKALPAKRRDQPRRR